MKLAMRSIVVGTALALGVMAAPRAQVSIGISTPSVSIGINVPAYPTMTVIPGYPVYYAPQVDANYFFYDGLYWVYVNDNWYSSYWYNGPWTMVAPVYVPVYVLRVPVRYYRVVPVYFRGWQPDAPPHWGQRWGRDWEQRRSGWDRWDRSAAPRPAPLPTYQRQYTGERYPRRDQQVVLHDHNYRYQPRDNLVREQIEKERLRAPTPQARSTPPGQAHRDSPQAHRDSPQAHRGGLQAAPATGPQVNAQPPARQGGPSRDASSSPEQQRKDAQRDTPRAEPPGQARREAPPQQTARGGPVQQPAPPPKTVLSPSHRQPQHQPPAQVQRGGPPQQHAQGRADEPPRVPPDGGRGGPPHSAGNAGHPNGNGKIQTQDRGGGHGKSGPGPRQG